ncbi:unnamed protein product [Victoria cruziana]
MLGEGASIDHAPPWSLFGEAGSFPEPYSPGTSPGSGRVLTLPVSGVTIPHGQNHLVHDAFAAGVGGCGSPEPVGFHKDSSGDVLAALQLQRFLPSNNEGSESGGAVDAYSCDEFRMYDFKVRRCVRGRSHDWTECPYAHPGEKARRRDPRKFHYSGTACPDFRKGSCKRGDACEFAHGVFECWLHPARYRTQPCKDGTACRRRVCFFAHTPEQLRVLPQSQPGQAQTVSSPRLGAHSLGDSYDGSPLRQALAAGLDLDSYLAKSAMISSPTSILVGHGVTSPPAISPPSSPSGSPPLSPAGASNPGQSSYICAFSPRRTIPTNSMSDVLASLRNLQISKAKTTAWPAPQFLNSPRGASSLRPSHSSLPATPTGWAAAPDIWDCKFGPAGCGGLGLDLEEEEPAERVESGRDVRAKMFARLSKQNSLERPETPDVGWVSELVK